MWVHYFPGAEPAPVEREVMYPHANGSRRMQRRLPRRMPPKRLPCGAESSSLGFFEGVAIAQGVITESALRKAQEAGENGLAKFVVRLSDGLLMPSEIESLSEMGMVEYLPFFKQALVVLPGRCLLDVAELPSVVQVV